MRFTHFISFTNLKHNSPAIKMSLESSAEVSGLANETEVPEVENTASSCVWTVLLSRTVTLPGNETKKPFHDMAIRWQFALFRRKFFQFILVEQIIHNARILCTLQCILNTSIKSPDSITYGPEPSATCRIVVLAPNVSFNSGYFLKTIAPYEQ